MKENININKFIEVFNDLYKCQETQANCFIIWDKPCLNPKCEKCKDCPDEIQQYCEV